MEHLKIQSNSVLAILDKALHNARLQPEYSLQNFIDEKSEKITTGLILSNVKVDKIDMLTKFSPDNLHKLGILGFVNGEEPDNGRVPLHKVVPKMNDIISLAVIEQGTYEGNFKEILEGKQIKGAKLIISHKVKEIDLKNTKPIRIIAKK
jgi:hypothetical protein